MKKGVILATVVGIMSILFMLAYLAISIQTQETRIAEHKIRRMRAFYTAQAAIVSAVENLRNGVNPDGNTVTLNNITATVQYLPYLPPPALNLNPRGPNNTSLITITVPY